MDWDDIVDTIYLWYNEFFEWYSVQPIYGQIFIIIGVIALLTLAIVLVYYVIKGIAYLIYYILKGVYYLLKGIGLGFFKLCEGFYYLVSGEEKPAKSTQNEESQTIMQHNDNSNNFLYCSECGQRFSIKMTNQIYTNGTVFCANCGKQFRVIELQKPLQLVQ
ncbi:MAG: hypothetical protein ACXAEX_13375 [Promethearchaeota archaeon]|jgi:transcription elongation factor Elf1